MLICCFITLAFPHRFEKRVVGRTLLMQSSRNWKVAGLILVQSTSPREPGETRHHLKNLGVRVIPERGKVKGGAGCLSC